MPLNDTPSWLDRFWSKVDKTGECWLWTACRSNPGGYGFFGLDGKNRLAHRIAWELINGPIPDGMCICHNCPDGDNPACVNPSHMFLGTKGENTRDAAKKGMMPSGTRNGKYTKPERTPRGDNHHSRIHPERLNRGQDRPQSKLTEDQVRTIRARYAAGGVSQRRLAAEYGMSQTVIGVILRGQGWKHLL